MSCTQKPKSDISTVIIHWLIVVTLVGTALSGLAIASVDNPELSIVYFFSFLLPEENVWLLHITYSIGLIASLTAYAIYIRKANITDRVRFSSGRLRALFLGGRPRWSSVNLLLYWFLFATLAVELSGVVHACQARILSDIQIETEEVPPCRARRGARRVGSRPRACRRGSEHRAGSALDLPPRPVFQVQVQRIPTRSYSATRPLMGRPRARAITLQIRRQEGGRVSPHLGRSIQAGHPVSIEGPYGSAFLRDGKTERLVLLSSGTGFAPIWGIACAALRKNPERKIVLIAGVRTADPIYMTPALAQLVRFPNVEVIVTIGRRPDASEQVREGYPNDHIPSLSETDIVYACGPSHLIEALSSSVAGSKAQFYFDPFEPAQDEVHFIETLKRLKRLLTEQPEFVVTVPNPLASLRLRTSG